MAKIITGNNLFDAIDAKMMELAEEQRRVAAMSPEDRAEWEKEEAKRQEETEEILKQLRGPGFVELKL